MKHLWQVFWFELRRHGRRRAYRFTTFGIPLIALILFFGYQGYQSLRASPAEQQAEESTEAEEADIGMVGYVDHSGLFPEPGLFSTGLIRYESEAAALEAMASGEVETVYAVGADYLETGDVTRYTDSFSLDSFSVDGFFQSFLLQNLLRDGVDRRVLARLQSDLSLVEHRVTDAGRAEVAQSEDTSFVLVYLFAILLAFATFFSGGYLMQSVIEEKETRMVEIVLSAVRPLPLLAGKVLSSGLLGLIQITVWVATAVFLVSRVGDIFPALAGVAVRPDLLLWVGLYFLLGYLFYAGVYAGIGAIAPSMREGPQLAVFITLPAMIPFYFLSAFAEAPNGALPVVLSLFPVTAPLAMVQRLSVTAVPLPELLVSLALLAVAAAGTIWLAGRLFRVNTLLAGQMPKWRDLVRIVREG